MERYVSALCGSKGKYVKEVKQSVVLLIEDGKNPEEKKREKGFVSPFYERREEDPMTFHLVG